MTTTHYSPTPNATGPAWFRVSVCGRETRIGDFSRAGSSNREHVTCKRCLASVAKRDREFQRKSRVEMAAIAFTKPHNVYQEDREKREDSECAVAREEGRS
jgi:hypothetical protein